MNRRIGIMGLGAAHLSTSLISQLAHETAHDAPVHNPNTGRAKSKRRSDRQAEAVASRRLVGTDEVIEWNRKVEAKKAEKRARKKF